MGTPSHLGHMDRVAATMPSQAHAGAAQEAPDKGQWEGRDVPLVRPSSCNVKGGIPSSRRYLPTSIQLPSSEKNYISTLANVEMISSVAKMVDKLGAATTVANKASWPATVRRTDRHPEEENVGKRDQAHLEDI